MSNIILGKSNFNELFKTDKCNIGNGAVIIHLRNCDITINPVMSIDNAAKLAAKTIYEVMELEEAHTSEPEWVNSVTFATEEMERTPAVKIIDDRLYINSPPFIKTKKNKLFWTKFTYYWYIMTLKAMTKSLFNRKDRTFIEDNKIEIASKVKI